MKEIHKGNCFSWDIINDRIAYKKTDSSVYNDDYSGIPVGIKWFFDASNIEIGERIDNIILVYNNHKYDAHIERKKNGRTGIKWDRELTKAFNYKFDSNLDSPIMGFYKMKEKNSYVIHFFFESSEEIIKEIDNADSSDEKENLAKKLDLETLKKLAIKRENEKPEERKTKIQRFRDPIIAEYTKKRAMGICQLCGCPAPFRDSYGEPYLESHHLKWLSNGGEDSIKNTVALCPNCHRKMHIVNDEKDIERLQNLVKKLSNE